MKRKNLLKTGLCVLTLGLLTGCGTPVQTTNESSLLAADVSSDKATSPFTCSLTEATVEVGKSTQALVTINGTGTSGDFLFASSNTAVASVDTKGSVNAKAVGEATITVYDSADLSLSAQCKVTVVNDIDQKFSVKFLNYDGSLLYEDIVDAGGAAEYKGFEPVRPNSATLMYKFSGWDTDFSNITSNTIVRATSAESDFSDYFFEGVNGVYKFVGYSGSEETLTIPTTFNGGIVNAIGSRVLEGNTSVKKVIIPNGIESIDDYAFAQNTVLEEVTVAGSVFNLGTYMFYQCSTLTKVTFEEGVTEVPAYCFNQASALTEVVLPSTVKRIDEYAFFMSGLTTLTVPESVTYLGSSFAGSMPNLTSVTIKGDIVTDEDSTSWFSSSKLLTSVTFEKGCDALLMACFMSCTALTEITLPDNCVTLGPRAFSGCTALAKITLGTQTSNFQEDALLNVPALTSDGILLKEGDINHKFSEDGNILYSNGGAKISLVLDQSQVPASINFSELGITEIGDYAFFENETLTSIDLTGVTSIGESAFESCENVVQDLVIPASVTHLGNGAFWGTGITKLDIQTTFGDGVVPSESFRNNKSLAEVKMVSGITRIDYRAFGYCGKEFKACYVPKTVTSLGQYAFMSNNNLVVYFEGTEEEWDAITIDNGNAGSFSVEYESWTTESV